MMFAGTQRVGAHLRHNHHTHVAALATDAIGAPLADQRRLVNRVGIGLEDVLNNVEFGHEHRVRSVMCDSIVGGA